MMPLLINVFDYGAGNLHSLVKSLERTDTVVRVIDDAAAAVHDADALVLPGVGAFSHAAQRLAGGRDVMRHALQSGLPTLGICLGMQLLFDDSEEGPGTGLGLVPGTVRRLKGERVPQIGWNEVEWESAVPGSNALEVAYYANSFVCEPASGAGDCVVAWSEHESDRFPAAIRINEVVGVQFHPEKSSAPGVRFVHAFLDRVDALRTSGGGRP